MDLKDELKRIRREADHGREENLRFADWLRESPMSDEELDSMVHSLAPAATARVDCVECHNCCLKYQPQATAAEVDALIGHLGISLEEFYRNYTVDAPLADILISQHRDGPLRNGACIFLQENGCCSVYSFRFSHCHSYPRLMEPGFRERLWDVVDACHVCPIVADVFEELKRRLWSHRPPS